VSGPLIFIATNKLRQGALEAETRRAPDFADFVAANEPRLLAFNEYLDEERSEVTIVQVHPDAASMELHLELVRERATRAFEETLEGTTRVQVLGAPSEEMLRSLRRQAGDQFAFSAATRHLGGFTRGWIPG
jgi:predicted aconitase